MQSRSPAASINKNFPVVVARLLLICATLALVSHAQPAGRRGGGDAQQQSTPQRPDA
jgi:hypothetical protein